MVVTMRKHGGLAEILASRKAPGMIVRNKIEAFKSSVDGSVVTNKKELDEHNRRNDVIDVREWGNDQFCDLDAKKEREARILGTSVTENKKRKNDFAESVQKLEQGYKPTIRQQED